jgi:hypothetical protein
MKTIKGDLILKKDTIIKGDLKVEGNIIGKDGKRFNLRVNGDLNCRNLTCLDLNCRNLNCWNLTCLDLTCLDLTCWNLTCLDLTCFDLKFYAVAIAYYSFKCKTWKATRDNYIIKCLDGKIIGEQRS